MKEKLKIIVDDKNHTHIWIDGKEIKHITKIKCNFKNIHEFNKSKKKVKV